MAGSTWGAGRRRQDGASAVEFAIVLPILVLFIFGIITFGLAFARAQGMEAAAREGARVASLGRDIEFIDVQSATRNAAPPFINSDHIDVTVNGTTDDGWCDERGDPVTVSVEIASQHRHNYALVVPLWPGSGTEPSYAANGVFRCEAEHE